MRGQARRLVEQLHAALAQERAPLSAAEQSAMTTTFRKRVEDDLSVDDIIGELEDELGARLLERDNKKAIQEFKAYLANQGITLGAKQETKTKAALDFFKAKLESDRLGGGAATRR